jgi:hypothetical protein
MSTPAQAHNIAVQPAPAGSLVAALSGWLDKGINKLIGGSDLPGSGPSSASDAERRGTGSEPGSPRGVRAAPRVGLCTRTLPAARLSCCPPSGCGRPDALDSRPR